MGTILQKSSYLLANMSPSLNQVEMVSCCVPNFPDPNTIPVEPFAIIREDEGWTIILSRESADVLDWSYEGVFCCITLQVNSSLEAVGLTAVVATELTKHSISANVVAAFHHDHIFVPAERANDALTCLQSIQRQHT